ncbi:MAG: ATP-binding protein [Rhodothermaceae bacterium]|nr:ATP-binding protein [Rhodothermaceae bacterium]MXZ18776.1 ATP-binding protein [Rhodothermaceae bacterium]MYE63268.1 ATP-binding protein [Rhodothermaceae bacterium]MYG70244.1 ATP-binding protein [Rhodothermaceae bacterium]MYJ19908.1 ATP-binding protein [Rhodothermaceae bacterium]
MPESRPSPITPLSVALDRGATRYFHGRKRILGSFSRYLERAEQIKSGGTTFLIQGAPGVGKTALLDEIALGALRNEWDVVHINLDDLYNPVHMAQTIGKYYVTRKQTSTKVDVKFLSREYIKDVAGDSSVSQVLEKMRPKRGMVLVLDEAQRIGRFYATPNEISVLGTLDILHNGRLPHPVFLLAAGLRTTLRAFGSLKISRFAENCVVELGPLSKESERAVILDWLEDYGGVKEDPAAWIDTIAKETYGWPRHVQSYSRHAAEHLKANLGIMMPNGLEAVLELGRKGRKMYYKQRLNDFSGDEVICLTEAIKDVDSGRPFNEGLVVASLSEKYGHEEANKLFQKFLDKGVIESDGFLYSVPIPSMHDWMKSELDQVQERLRACY